MMISDVRSFIFIYPHTHFCTYSPSSTANLALDWHPACDLSPIIIFLSLSLCVFSHSLSLSYSFGNCSTIAVQNSIYPVLVGDYSKHFNTHTYIRTRRCFSSSHLPFLFVAFFFTFKLHQVLLKIDLSMSIRNQARQNR